MFPIINTIDDILPAQSDNLLIRTLGGNPRVKFACYMVSNPDVFRGEHADLEREFRGITFIDGVIASRPVHKFFNVGERESVMPNNLNWAEVSRVMVKADGSMIHPVIIDGEIQLKSKKSIDAAVVIAAMKTLGDDLPLAFWIKEVMRAGYTPIMEYTSPKYPIVIRYESTTFTLLHIRNNVTGEYLTPDHEFFKYAPIPTIESVKAQFEDAGVVSWQKIDSWCKTAENIEGVVIQFKNGDMVKAKTDWYRRLHHVVTFVRERDVAVLALNDAIDDLVANWRLCGYEQKNIDRAYAIQQQVWDAIHSAKNAAIAEAERIKLLTNDRKEAYTEHIIKLDANVRAMVMQEYLGLKFDYVKWYNQYKLKTDWGLDVLTDVVED